MINFDACVAFDQMIRGTLRSEVDMACRWCLDTGSKRCPSDTANMLISRGLAEAPISVSQLLELNEKLHAI